MSTPTEDDESTMDAEFRARCHSTDKESWKQAAKADGRSLSQWMRRTLNAAAKRSAKGK